MKGKRAMVIVSGSYVLMQAFWFVLAYPEYDWSITLLKTSETNDGLFANKKLCEKSGLFKEIYVVENSEKYAKPLKKIMIFLKMCFYYVCGKKNSYCKRYIEDRIGKFDYDLICLGSSFSFFEGAALNFSDKIETIVMQEGLGDYVYVDLDYDYFTRVAGKLLYKMKYVNYLVDTSYPLYAYCTKYATSPSDIPDKNFKKICKLFDESIVEKKEYVSLINKIYDIEMVNDYDVVVFTTTTFSIDKNMDSEMLVKYLKEEYLGKKIFVKKHPRDVYEYNWEGLDVECGYSDIPGEVLIQRLDKAEFIFAFPSTLMLSVIHDKSYNYKLLKFTTGMPEAYTKGFEDMKNYLKISDEKIIQI